MISPDTIARVKERTDIVALVGETVRLTRQGRKFVGLCPFHKEKTPSFHVSPERGFFYCFGCKEAGDAFAFVMKTDGLSFTEAVRALAERAGVEIVEDVSDARVREEHAARKAREDLYAVNQLAATYFERCLWGAGERTPPHPLSRIARAEIERRGLVLDDDGGLSPAKHALQAFRVGYAPYGWDGLATFLREQGISPLVAERVGLLVPRSSGSGHYDRFRHRLMFAVVDVLGRVVAFSGRALREPSADELAALGIPAASRGDADQKPAKYVNSPESPIYVKGEHLFGLYQARQAIRQSGQAVLVEGNFDVVSLHARGVGNVVAPLGTALTSAQARLLKRFAPTVVLLYDGDAAGRKATRAARAPCREGGLVAKVAVMPEGLDPDELCRTRGPEAIARLVKNARGLLEHLVDEALDGAEFGGATLTEQLARVRAVVALLAEEDDPSLRAMAKTYADRLASRMTILGRAPADLRQLEQIVEQAVARPSRPSGPAHAAAPALPHDRARSRARTEEIANAVLGAILDFPELLGDPEVEEALGVLEGEAALAIAALRQNLTHGKSLYAAEFLAQIAAPIHSFAAGRLASPVYETASDARSELLNNARKLRRLGLVRENAAVVEKLHRAKSLVDVSEEEALLREAERRAREKAGLV